ncbi:E3 ubiquitin-protein ligase COP1-like [Oscarella lobularis]|uniref:E3 ubiquitin-protein ligase COP1-like n=1 Tax=Oscarella lobularis TaxID=121494 RepID=UPI003313D093
MSISGRSGKRSRINLSSGVAAKGQSASKMGKNDDATTSDYLCPICFDVINEAYITKCGHSFCHVCITKSLKESNRCPKCNLIVEKPDFIFPNFTLNELILKQKQKEASIMNHLGQKKGVGHLGFLTQELSLSGSIYSMGSAFMRTSVADVNFALTILEDRRRHLEMGSAFIQNELMLEFLQKTKSEKSLELERLQAQLNIIDEDLMTIQSELSRQSPLQRVVKQETIDGVSFDTSPLSTLTKAAGAQAGFNGSLTASVKSSMELLAQQKNRLHMHLPELESTYCKMRLDQFNAPQKGALERFGDTLVKATQFSDFRTLATLTYGDVPNGSSIVSSIEFARDSDYFAIAGVTKKIKIYDYMSVINNSVDVHYPVKEMSCTSKISCVSWNTFHKTQMASSDYEGIITLWDAFSGEKTAIFQEHEKRCWSVDFNSIDPKLLVSGSDDAKVKIWSTDSDHSEISIEARANVCCVKFSPTSRHHLAFGSADHCVHYYDLRNPKRYLGILKGHRKAVSYTKFLDGEHIISASTDSQLKLWNVDASGCQRTFKGHVNEKNFVGLATNGEYIACGSENNSVCVYYGGLSKLLLSHKFSSVKHLLEKGRRDEETTDFVSAVSWRPGSTSSVLIAANSQGVIKLLEMV